MPTPPSFPILSAPPAPRLPASPPVPKAPAAASLGAAPDRFVRRNPEAALTPGQQIAARPLSHSRSPALPGQAGESGRAGVAGSPSTPAPVVVAPPTFMGPPAAAAVPAKPGFFKRLADGWKHAWAPSWAGVPNWVHGLWESSGRLSGKFHAKARQSAVGRTAIAALGTVMAGVWAAVDKVAGLRGLTVPAFAPATALERPLPTFPGPATWLGTRGNQIVDPAGTSVRLRGVNLSGFEFNKTADPLTPARLDQLKAMGANVIRVPLNQDWVLADPAYVQRLDQAVERAAARGMYVLFDMHWIDGHQAAAPTAETAQMWRQLANRYSQQPAVLYDLHNEPGMIGWETNAQWAEALIKEIRQVHPRSLVMVEGTNKGQRIAAAVDRPVQAANVVYQVHAYGPRQHGPGVGPAQWDRMFGKAAETLPVFVGEFGGLDDELGAISDLLKYLDTKNLGWAAWHVAPGDVFAADGSLAPLGKLVQAGLKR